MSPGSYTWYERSIQRIGVVSVVGSSSLDTKSHLHGQLWVIRTLRTLLHTRKASSFVVQFTIGLHYISFGVVNYSIFDRKVIADSTQYSYATALKIHKIECIMRFFYPWRRHRRRLILQYFLMLFLPKTVGFQLATFVSWGVRSHSEMLLRGVGFLYLILFMIIQAPFALYFQLEIPCYAKKLIAETPRWSQTFAVPVAFGVNW